MSLQKAGSKKDPHTGEPFIPKRSNQKFANLANKIAYNNEKAQQRRNQNLGINKVLNKNAKILERILGAAKEANKSKDYLEGAEFVFGNYTHMKTFNNRSYYCVFNYGFHTSDRINFHIIKFQ
jgi:hypothetical protein